MKIVNKKGFGLIMAIMIVTVLLIMAAGFFQLTDYSRKSVSSNVENLRMYWAAESSSNYNVNYWVNLPDSISSFINNKSFFLSSTERIPVKAIAAFLFLLFEVSSI